MFRSTAVSLFILLFCFKATSYAQKSIGLNFNRNYFSYHKVAEKYLLGNTGIGASFLKKDTIKRFINYELSIGFDFNNISFIDQYNNPPFFDGNNIYTHTINNLNINASLSLKKNLFKHLKYSPYVGFGATPKIFIFSSAKVFYNDSLYYNGDGVRLTSGEFFKIYDLFYLGIEFHKKLDIRIKSEGVILQKLGFNNFYYFRSEREINYNQLSLQIMLNL